MLFPEEINFLKLHCNIFALHHTTAQNAEINCNAPDIILIQADLRLFILLLLWSKSANFHQGSGIRVQLLCSMRSKVPAFLTLPSFTSTTFYLFSSSQNWIFLFLVSILFFLKEDFLLFLLNAQQSSRYFDPSKHHFYHFLSVFFSSELDSPLPCFNNTFF